MPTKPPAAWSGRSLNVKRSLSAETLFALAMAGTRYDEVPHKDGPLIRLRPDTTAGMGASSAALAVDG
jgi:hypothetical protein